jgi:hypothetical protein
MRVRWGALAIAVALVGSLLVVAVSTGTRAATHGRRQVSWPVEKRALLGELAILRRPQRKGDVTPTLVNGLLRTFGARDTFDRALIRRATAASGAQVFLVPVKRAAAGGSGLLVAGAGGGGCCASATTIRHGKAWMTSGPPNRVLLIVPDGVARVRLTLRTGPDRTHPPTVSGPVHDNVIVLEIPFAAETLSDDPMTWYGPDGRVVKRLGG